MTPLETFLYKKPYTARYPLQQSPITSGSLSDSSLHQGPCQSAPFLQCLHQSPSYFKVLIRVSLPLYITVFPYIRVPIRDLLHQGLYQSPPYFHVLIKTPPPPFTVYSPLTSGSPSENSLHQCPKESPLISVSPSDQSPLPSGSLSELPLPL